MLTTQKMIKNEAPSATIMDGTSGFKVGDGIIRLTSQIPEFTTVEKLKEITNATGPFDRKDPLYNSDTLK
jgi:hypothetical protein